MSEKPLTDFGRQSVTPEEKTRKVREVFHSVAPQYDLMNDLMSLGVHRLWKQRTIQRSGVFPGAVVLDLAGGTGDLAKALQKRAGSQGRVVLADINEEMLKVGRDRLIDQGFPEIEIVQANAEALPFPDATFDIVTMAFGLRNVTDKMAALGSIFRVLKPGGQLLVLEFSTPSSPFIAKIYDAYSFHIIPKLGRLIAKDAESYQYLVESIRKHPNQETLKKMMETAGFSSVTYQNFTQGVVALHIGRKGE